MNIDSLLALRNEEDCESLIRKIYPRTFSIMNKRKKKRLESMKPFVIKLAERAARCQFKKIFDFYFPPQVFSTEH